jgi:probable HAF family extracellular repeat protein
MIDLGTLGGTGGFALGLNNRGQVIGDSSLPGDVISHVFLWTAPGPMRDLGTPGAQGGDAAAINDAGEVVGIDFNSGHGFLWRNGTITDLGTLHGDCASGAFGINAHTQVVGQSFTCDGVARAFMWENGTMIDLNVFVPPGVNLTLVEVEQINDPGEMFGIGTLADGNSRAFLLIPCDENHPNIEGCDYSLVDASATASVSSMLTTRLSPDSIRQLMQSAGRRSKPWYRGFGAQTQPK